MAQLDFSHLSASTRFSLVLCLALHVPFGSSQGLWFAYQNPFSQSVSNSQQYYSSGQSALGYAYNYNVMTTQSPAPTATISSSTSITVPVTTQTIPTTAVSTSTAPVITTIVTSPPSTLTSTTTVVTTSTPVTTTSQTTATTTFAPQCGVPNGDPSIFQSLQRERDNDLPEFLQDLGQLRRSTAADRIVGGASVPNGSGFECWQIIITLLGSPVFGAQAGCGGTIVGSRTIVTAAHCKFVVPSELTAFNVSLSTLSYAVTIGVISKNPYGPNVPRPAQIADIYDQVVPNCFRSYNVTQFIQHPAFIPTNTSAGNDIAVIQLAEPIDFTQQAACACKLCLNRRSPAPGTKCIASGFGSLLPRLPTDPEGTSPTTPIPLKFVPVNLFGTGVDPACDVFGPPAGNLCGIGSTGSTCTGDSGGPLFCLDPATNREYLAGDVASGEGCGNNVTQFFADVAHYMDFVTANAFPGDALTFIP